MNNFDKLLLNEKDAAHLLSMSTHFLRRDRISDRSAGIPFIRVGGAVRYRRADLEAWVLAQTKKMSPTIFPIEDNTNCPIVEKRRVGRPRKVTQIDAQRDVMRVISK